MTLLAYVDESERKPYFFLGSVVADGNTVNKLEAGLSEILEELYESGVLTQSNTRELHGHDLFQGKGDWSNLAPRQRIGVYSRALGLISESGAKVVVRGLDCERQKAKYSIVEPPHEVVMGHLLERVNDYAKRVDDKALIVADEVHAVERHRTNFRDYKQNGTPGYRSSKLPYLIDTLHFAPSHHSSMLQAADLVTFVYGRRHVEIRQNDPSALATRRLWHLLDGAVLHHGVWYPR